MFDFAVCEIAGKQIKVLPNQPFEVTLKGEEKPVANVLLLMENGRLKLGKPYLKDEINFDVVEQTRGPKIRVFKFHAKANFRKLKGHRAKLTKIITSPVKKQG